MTDLASLLNNLNDKLEQAKEQYKQASLNVKSVQRTITLLDPKNGSEAAPKSNNELDPKNEANDNAEPNDESKQPVLMHGNLRPDDIADCESTMAALIKMAQDNDNIVTLPQACELMVKAGLSKSKPKNLIANTHTKLKNGDDWERVGPSMFRYFGNATDPIK